MGTPSSKRIEIPDPPPKFLTANGAAMFADDGAEDRPRPRSASPRIEGRTLRKSNLHLDARSRAVFYLMSGVLHALSLIPDFILYPIGVIGGFIGYCFDRRHVKIGMKNLSIAFPERSEAERRRILRASYINLGKGAAEYIRLAGFFHITAARSRPLRSLSLLGRGCADDIPAKGWSCCPRISEILS